MFEDSKQEIAYVLRKLHLIFLADKILYLHNRWRCRRQNRDFVKDHAGEPMPPAWLMWDAYKSTSYDWYWRGGKLHSELIGQHITTQREKASQRVHDECYRILDWGCGPARVLRFLSEELEGDSVKLFGSDYNAQSVEWCKAHFPELYVAQNLLEPPLSFDSESFDVVYCISVFTHLSEEMHQKWMQEIWRVLKLNGVFIGTFHGDNCRVQLRDEEMARYDAGLPVFRGHVKEGSRLFVAYHPDRYMREDLLRDFSEVAMYNVEQKYKMLQSIWVAQK